MAILKVGVLPANGAHLRHVHCIFCGVKLRCIKRPHSTCWEKPTTGWWFETSLTKYQSNCTMQKSGPGFEWLSQKEKSWKIPSQKNWLRPCWQALACKKGTFWFGSRKKNRSPMHRVVIGRSTRQAIGRSGHGPPAFFSGTGFGPPCVPEALCSLLISRVQSDGQGTCRVTSQVVIHRTRNCSPRFYRSLALSFEQISSWSTGVKKRALRSTAPSLLPEEWSRISAALGDVRDLNPLCLAK